MRVRTAVLALSLVSCESSSSPGPGDAATSTVSHEDGAVCACATPDCLPNCVGLPACKLVCTSATTGAVLEWVDSCGTVEYTQACASGCGDGGTASCD